ncbi:hypothetical protein TIFTF001_029572 [Ficus carica]|uniref:Uncharacterized protein n=1 Tax=Ficus carica TaxID=3494 RepID=A0AA88DS93_FICCA|nr:hypothetical protein TIFTF001_029572 [Ficus carica]
MNIVMFGKTVQSLINKPCSILTIQEGYTDLTVIPSVLNQLKGISKIFVIQFRPRRAFIDAVIVKTFDDDVQPLSLPAPTTMPSEEIPPSVISFDPETPQVGGKKTGKKQLTFTEPIFEEEKSSPQHQPPPSQVQLQSPSDPSKKRKETRSDEKLKKIKYE